MDSFFPPFLVYVDKWFAVTNKHVFSSSIITIVFYLIIFMQA